MTESKFEERRPPRPFNLAAVAVTGVLAGGFLGATTNAVNGSVSPLYFITILHWGSVENIHRASVALGAFEGLLFGVFLSCVFTLGVGVITGSACTYRFALKHLLGILAGTYGSWALGGMAVLGLATLSPEFYRRTFIGVPEEFASMLGYAWVGGSIWGAELGSLVCVILGLVLLRSNWRYQVDTPKMIPMPPNALGDPRRGGQKLTDERFTSLPAPECPDRRYSDRAS
jgi:hypothetical protein